MKVYSQDLGIRSDYLLTMRLRLPTTKYPHADSRQQFFERLAPRLEAVPGAEVGGDHNQRAARGRRSARRRDRWPPNRRRHRTAGRHERHDQPDVLRTVGAPLHPRPRIWCQRWVPRVRDRHRQCAFRFRVLRWRGSDRSPYPISRTASRSPERRPRSGGRSSASAQRSSTARRAMMPVAVGRLRSAATGASRLCRPARPQPGRSCGDGQQHQARSPGHRSGSAGLHGETIAQMLRAAAVAVSRVRDAVW